MKNIHKGLLAIIILALLAAGSVWAYFKLSQPQNISPTVVNHKTPIAPTPTLTNVIQSQQSTSTLALAPQLASSTPQEQNLGPSPRQPSSLPSQIKQLGDLHLVKYRYGDPTAQFIYFEVQGMNVNGAQLVLAFDSYCDGEGCTPGDYRFLQDGNKFTLLTKYSAPLDGSYGLEKSDLNTANFNDMDIPALDFPTQLQDPKSGAVIKYVDGSYNVSSFFDPTGRILVFSDSGSGAYSTNGSNDETFYAQAPDGTELTYNLVDNFLPDPYAGQTSTLNITWNDGIKHGTSYQMDMVGTDGPLADYVSCEEGSDYVNAVTSTPISLNDLAPVGVNAQGQAIYAIQNQNNRVLKAAQAQAVRGVAGDYPPYEVIFWQDPFGRLIRFVSNDMIGFCGGKPVIYLYPTKPMNVSVQVAPVGGISKSEPAYNNGWNVFAQPNGTLADNGHQYPYLFWEGPLGSSYNIPERGFVVDVTNVKSLLTDKLSVIGLNTKEISDFEQFWLPRMQTSPYYFVTFTVNQQMEQYAPLIINPKPDTVIRVLMDYKPLENYQAVTPLDLPHTERRGFTVVEWGGILK